jgi:hypothetical protein
MATDREDGYGGVLTSMDLYRQALAEQEALYANRFSNPDIWGSAGAYYGGLANLGSGESSMETPGFGESGVTINGQRYGRTGTAENSRFDPFGGGYFYDPTYGWVVPESVAKAYSDADNSSELAFGAALGLVAMPYMAATGLASFGAGAGTGAEGAGTVMVDGTPMNLGGGLTNFDSGLNYFGGYAGPTSGSPTLLSDGGQSVAGGVDDFGMDTLPDLIQGGPVRTTAEGMATSLGGTVPPWLESIINPNGAGLANTLLGKVAPSVLGYMGASKQADAYKDLMNQYFSLGAPYRDLLQKSYQPGFSLQNEPGFKDAMDTAHSTYMRAASAGNAQGVAGGNPFDNPGAFMESQKYLMGSLGLPYLQNYRSGLSGAGQLGLGPAAQFGGAGVNAEGGKYDAIGYGLGEVFNPKPDYMKQFANLFAPKLSTGGGLV